MPTGRLTIRLLLGILPMLSGCASIGIGYGGDSAYNAAFRTKIEDASKLTPNEQVRLKEIKIIASVEGLNSVPRGEVVGLSCKLTVALLVFKWTWRPVLNETNGLTPEEAALTQLRLKAMQKGANAVAAPSCTHKDGVDWGNNCFESWICSGQAVLVQ